MQQSEAQTWTNCRVEVWKNNEILFRASHRFKLQLFYFEFMTSSWLTFQRLTCSESNSICINFAATAAGLRVGALLHKTWHICSYFSCCLLRFCRKRHWLLRGTSYKCSFAANTIVSHWTSSNCSLSRLILELKKNMKSDKKSNRSCGCWLPFRSTRTCVQV